MAEDKSVVQGLVMAELNRFIEDEFKARWSWVDLAVEVAKNAAMCSYFELVEKPVLAVLSLAGYLADKVQLIEHRAKK